MPVPTRWRHAFASGLYVGSALTFASADAINIHRNCSYASPYKSQTVHLLRKSCQARNSDTTTPLHMLTPLAIGASGGIAVRLPTAINSRALNEAFKAIHMSSTALHIPCPSQVRPGQTHPAPHAEMYSAATELAVPRTSEPWDVNHNRIEEKYRWEKSLVSLQSMCVNFGIHCCCSSMLCSRRCLLTVLLPQMTTPAPCSVFLGGVCAMHVSLEHHVGRGALGSGCWPSS